MGVTLVTIICLSSEVLQLALQKWFDSTQKVCVPQGTQNSLTPIIVNNIYALNTNCAPLGYYFLHGHQAYNCRLHTYLFCVLVVIVRDFQIFKTIIVPANDVSFDMLARVLQIKIITDYSRKLPGGLLISSSCEL